MSVNKLFLMFYTEFYFDLLIINGKMKYRFYIIPFMLLFKHLVQDVFRYIAMNTYLCEYINLIYQSYVYVYYYIYK